MHSIDVGRAASARVKRLALGACHSGFVMLGLLVGVIDHAIGLGVERAGANGRRRQIRRGVDAG